MSAEWTRGRKLVVRVGWICIVITVSLFQLGAGSVPQWVVRYGVLLVLLYFLARGHSWARWTLGGLLLIGGGGTLLLGIAVMETSPWAWAVCAVGAAYLYCTTLLVASKSVRAFFADPAYRMSRRSGSESL
jgi:hypothetical protein